MKSRAALQTRKKKVWFSLIRSSIFFTLEKMGRRDNMKKEFLNHGSPREKICNRETRDEGRDMEVNLAPQKEEHIPSQVLRPF